MSFNTTSDIRKLFIDELGDGCFTIDKTGVKTVEVIGTSFLADAPAIFGKPNEDYIKREIAWYESQSLNVEDIPGDTPAIWKSIADEGGNINSNYGYLIFSEENGDQFKRALFSLVQNPNSRRATMIYTRPSMHTDYKVNGMSDFVCTNAVTYFIRDDCMHAVVQMRSNDVVFGYRNDYAWQRYVLNKMVDGYNDRAISPVYEGQIIWNAASLHVYERHFHLIG